MARKRMIAPQFFKHADLYDAEVASALPLRVAFAGLWTVADRRGVFPWSRNVKPDVLPYDPCDMLAVLEALAEHGFVQKYEVGGKWYGMIPTLGKHQHFHKDERASTLPAPGEQGASTVSARISTAPNGRHTTYGIRHTAVLPSPANDAGGPQKPRRPRAAPTAPAFALAPYLDAHAERFPGGMPSPGQLGKVLKALEAKHGPAETLARWRVFLAEKGHLGVHKFAETWSEWAPRQNGAAKSDLRPRVLAATEMLIE